MMTPHRSKRKTKAAVGSFLLDRTFRGVGRIKRASGTNRLATHTRINEMLTTLHDSGRLDLLRELRDGRRSFLEVYDAYRAGDLERLVAGPAATLLLPALATFAETYPCKPKTRSGSIRPGVARLTEAAPVRATVAELPAILRGLRTALASTPRAFNVTRSVAQAFVRETVGGRSALWAAVSDVTPLTVTPSRIKHPVMPLELLRMTIAMDEPLGAMAWTLAATGMRPAEYWSRHRAQWEDAGEYVSVVGTKTRGSVRKVPRVRAPDRPACGEVKFRHALFAAGAIKPYDLRRSFANWMEAAGIPRSRRKLYLGHGPGDITSLYEWVEVLAFLAEDSRRFRTWLDTQLGRRTHDRTHDTASVPLQRPRLA